MKIFYEKYHSTTLKLKNQLHEAEKIIELIPEIPYSLILNEFLTFERNIFVVYQSFQN